MIAVFLGPTLPVGDAATELDATYLPPAAQGDVYRAVRQGASAIGIVDGLFQRVPSVWHKEILWALSEQVPVYGSASMGALRAAELAAYGMVGVGSVFARYLAGELIDDDEVALTHLDAEHGFRATSDAMVDIRATVERAVREGVVGEATGAALVAAGKGLWYPDRTYPSVVSGARGAVDDAELAAFDAWWPSGRVSQKRTDAVAMLRRIREDAAAGSWPSPAPFWFERTALFDDLVRSAGELDFGGQPSLEGGARELAGATSGGAVGGAREAALARVLALDIARRHQYSVDDDGLFDAVIRFRSERGLVEPEDLERWMADNHLGRAQFLRLVADEARVEWVRSLLESEIDAMLADHLRVSGQFEGEAATAG
jgi:hypothetical protein